MGCGNGLSGARMAFGNTDRADGVPDLLAPSAGPAYLEGRLVLSLSFGGDPNGMEPPEESDDPQERYRLWDDLAGEWHDDPLERYRLWDDLAGEWHDDDLEVLRFEQVDVVVRPGSESSVLWKGSMDTRARVVPVPDLDGEGMAANAGCDLCWRRV